MTMTAILKLQTTSLRQVKRSVAGHGVFTDKVAGKRVHLAGAVKKYGSLREALDEHVEDAQLNAIADERSEGPFVKVSLNDL